jgi:hypothetical protein
MVAKSLFLILVMILPALPSHGGSDAEFDAHWHDGKAELDGYRLTVSRYGQERRGTCVLVYVTEPFSETKRVKVDDPKHNASDTFNALKLNIVRDFQTGIYDYNTMVSVFVRDADFSPVKISFTSAEWCGQVYEELRFDPKRITGHYFSYFEDESGLRDIENVGDGVAEDNLFVLLRGLRGDYLEPGAKKKVRILPSVYFGRLAHERPRWVEAEIRRSKRTKKIKVPAGKFETTVYEVKMTGGRGGKFFVEDHYPHRIIRWEMLPDVEAEMTGSERLQYWSLNRNGNESYLKKLGL